MMPFPGMSECLALALQVSSLRRPHTESFLLALVETLHYDALPSILCRHLLCYTWQRFSPSDMLVCHSYPLSPRTRTKVPWQQGPVLIYWSIVTP